MAALEPLIRIESTATPLPLDDLDTDVITPMHRVMDGTFVEHAFEVLRVDNNGQPKPNPFDDPTHADDEILVTGANFGCGSSRETAVWAIKEMGYRAIIAESFGDIFRGNCFRNAILPIELPGTAVTELTFAAESHAMLIIDVATASVHVDGRTVNFDLPALRRTALLEGLDDLDVAVRLEPNVEAFEHRDRVWRPWIHIR